jgi:tRNA A37 threonylcarbamoyltransferase TsaD
MSFSGLKTAARLTIEKLGTLSDQDICDVAASFQKAVSNIIYKKTKYAINEYEKQLEQETVIIKSSRHSSALAKQVGISR